MIFDVEISEIFSFIGAHTSKIFPVSFVVVAALFIIITLVLHFHWSRYGTMSIIITGMYKLGYYAFAALFFSIMVVSYLSFIS